MFNIKRHKNSEKISTIYLTGVVIIFLLWLLILSWVCWDLQDSRFMLRSPCWWNWGRSYIRLNLRDWIQIGYNYEGPSFGLLIEMDQWIIWLKRAVLTCYLQGV